MMLGQTSSYLATSTTSRRTDGSTSPPPPPPSRGGEENIPIVFGEALPVTTGGGLAPTASACEVVVAVDESNDTVASTYVVPTSNGHPSGRSYATAPPGHNRYMSSGSAHTTSSYDPYAASPYAAAPAIRSTQSVSGYAPYAAPPSQIQFPTHPTSSGQSVMTMSTSPMSVRSTYTDYRPASAVSPPPGRNSVSMLRSSVETTTPMTTSSGLRLQQLSMVSLEGRRMTPYVTKPRNSNNTSAPDTAANQGSSTTSRYS